VKPGVARIGGRGLVGGTAQAIEQALIGEIARAGGGEHDGKHRDGPPQASA